MKQVEDSEASGKRIQSSVAHISAHSVKDGRLSHRTATRTHPTRQWVCAKARRRILEVEKCGKLVGYVSNFISTLSLKIPESATPRVTCHYAW